MPLQDPFPQQSYLRCRSNPLEQRAQGNLAPAPVWAVRALMDALASPPVHLHILYDLETQDINILNKQIA